MFAYRLKNFICVTIAVLFALFFAVGVKSVSVARFADIEGERVYFLDSASSQGLRKETLSLADLTRVKGECVFTGIATFDGGMSLTKKELAQDIATRYGAEILFQEEACGVVSYYAYTPRWQDGLYINGVNINLHIAVGEERLAVGTPIIFDGF